MEVRDLERLAAEQLAHVMAPAPVGSPLPIHGSSELCSTLEVLVPALLSAAHPEWAAESIDGFYVSSAVKSDEGSVVLAGTCILIRDQTVTPFTLNMTLGSTYGFRAFRVRLGEAGGGPLGISGPPWGSSAALGMLLTLNDRLDGVEWVYDLTV